MTTILVVDDETTIRELMVELLGDEGYRVIPASNGVRALELLDQEKPDLVIMDIMMKLCIIVASRFLWRTRPP